MTMFCSKPLRVVNKIEEIKPEKTFEKHLLDIFLYYSIETDLILPYHVFFSAMYYLLPIFQTANGDIKCFLYVTDFSVI